ncbi:MAG: hypothetical protein QOG53_2160 [Frankiales bacterium]|nr:hypothetical protein [Frankiales bacterium]
MSTAVLIVVTSAAVGSAYFAQQLIDDQEQRLLHERAIEVAALYNVAVGSATASLGSLATVASVTDSDPAAFTRYAQRLLQSKANPGGYTGLALVKTSGARPSLVASIGTGVTAGRLAEPAVAQSLTRKSPTGFLTTPVTRSGDKVRIGSVLGAPAAPAGFVVYAEQVFDPFSSVDTPRTAKTPFSELIGAIYASSTADPAQVLQSSVRTVPVTGHVARATIDVGPDKWLIEVKARGSLVGSLAKVRPWVLLALGLLLAAVMTAIVEVLGRRRSYAEALVRERTQELSDSLAELERTQHQLVHSERLAAIGQVASTVGHELRNPLGVMANAIYLLRLRTDDPPAIRQLDTLDREVGSAARISSDLLDFARNRDPEWESVELSELISECLSVVPCPPGVTLVRDEAADLEHVRVDRDQLRQVLLNLLNNAYEAVPDGGTVTVATKRLDGAVRIDVVDNGAGADEATQARFFEPFFTTKTRGTGLGLAVCKRLIEGHSGSISVVSSPGEGARFTVVLPLTPVAPRMAADARAAERAGTVS